MSAPWEARLRAVASLAKPPSYKDGEVRCRACQNEKLNRSDLVCWKCGHDYFEILNEDLKKTRGVPLPMPPKVEEKPKEEPAWIFNLTSKPNVAPAQPTLPLPSTNQDLESYKKAMHDYMKALKSYENAVLWPPMMPPPPTKVAAAAEPSAKKRSILEELLKGGIW